MTSQPFSLDYTVKRQISNLIHQGHSPARDASAIVGLCQEQEGPMGGIAVLCMGMGYIELAEALVDAGANPRTRQPWGNLDGLGNPLMGNGPGVSVPWILSRWSFNDMASWGAKPRPRASGRAATLEHVMANPGRWPVDLDAAFKGKTPLVATLGENNQYNRHGQSRPKREGYRVGERDILEFARALLKHGADINHPDGDWSVLSACLPDHISGSKPDLGLFDWAIAHGADPLHMPHAAWARAISEDVNTAYNKRGPGERAQLLDRLGVPLVSPVNVPAATSPLVQAIRRGAGWAIDRMVATPGFDARWRCAIDASTILTVPGRPRKTTVDLLSRLPREHLVDVAGDNTQPPALHAAVETLDPDMVKLVLDLGVDPDVVNAQGKTALEASRVMTDRKRDQFQAIAEAIKAAGGTVEGSLALVRVAKTTAAQTIDDLLEQGVDVYSRDKAGRMAAQLVLTGPAITTAGLFDEGRSTRHVQALEVFVRHGFDVNAPLDNEGHTLLHYAVERCSMQAVEFLIGEGADPNAATTTGKTPLHMWDREWNIHSYAKHPQKIRALVRYMVEMGAEPFVADNDGKICLDQIGKHIPGVREAASAAVMQARTKGTGSVAKPMRF